MFSSWLLQLDHPLPDLITIYKFTSWYFFFVSSKMIFPLTNCCGRHVKHDIKNYRINVENLCTKYEKMIKIPSYILWKLLVEIDFRSLFLFDNDKQSSLLFLLSDLSYYYYSIIYFNLCNSNSLFLLGFGIELQSKYIFIKSCSIY